MTTELLKDELFKEKKSLELVDNTLHFLLGSQINFFWTFLLKSVLEIVSFRSIWLTSCQLRDRGRGIINGYLLCCLTITMKLS